MLIVRFRAGRHFGDWLLERIESGNLNRDDGDVVVWYNSTYNEPPIYPWVRKWKGIMEEKDLPFIIIEPCVVSKSYGDEKDVGLRYSYRMCNEHPYTPDNTEGYRSKEEMVKAIPHERPGLKLLNLRLIKKLAYAEFVRDWRYYYQVIPHAGAGLRATKSSLYIIHNGHPAPTKYETDQVTIRYDSDFDDVVPHLLDLPHNRDTKHWSQYTTAMSDKMTRLEERNKVYIM